MSLAKKFFLGFRRKHLFITTYIEKQCTQPLNALRRYAIYFSLQFYKCFFMCSTPQMCRTSASTIKFYRVSFSFRVTL